MSNKQGAPGTVIVNGKQLTMSPLSDEMIESINIKIRQDIIELARSTITKDTPQDQVDITMSAAFKRTAEVEWIAAPDKWLNPKYLMYLFWVGIKPNHPTYAFNDFIQDFGQDEEAVERCYDTFFLLQGQETAGNLAKAGMPKALKAGQKRSGGKGKKSTKA